MLKATYDSDEDGRIEKDALEWTLNKLLLGAGAGSNPTEIDVPTPSATLTVSESEVFSATSPTSWTDLDLSGTVGANVALVLLKVHNVGGGAVRVAVRKNGDTDEQYNTGNFPFGVGITATEPPVWTVVIVVTDGAGKIEWKTETGVTFTLDVIAYIK